MFGNQIRVLSKNKLFIMVSTTIHWVKPSWPAEPILLTLTLLRALPTELASQSLIVRLLIRCLEIAKTSGAEEKKERYSFI